MANAKLALVTGANRGIGREIARQLIQRGVRTIVTARRTADAESTATELGAEGCLELDVTDPRSIQQAAETVATRYGRLDILINNAGILLDHGASVVTVEESILNRTLETNTWGPLRMARAFWSLLSPHGRIVNISSGGGQLGDPADWAPAYCLSKTALNGVTVQLAQEGVKDGIAVNSACPGWVRTDMGGPSAARSVSQGADTPVWLALDAPPDLTGKFLRDRQVIPW